MSGFKTFSIKEIERLCDIKAHTIRIWEMRYGIIKPSRRSTAIRMYSIYELEKALKLCLLNRNGFKVSRLARMSDEEIQCCTKRLFTITDLQQKAVNHLLICMYRMNIEEFEAALDSCFLSWAMIDVLQGVIYPFLQKVNLFFQGKRLTEEHLVVTVIRKKLVCCIEKMESFPANNQKVLLFLCGERQLDLFLLYTACILKQRGYTVINLGADVTFKNLQQAIAHYQPQYLLTYCHKKQDGAAELFSDLLKEETCRAKMVVVQQERKKGKAQPNPKLIEVYYEDWWPVFEEEPSKTQNAE